MKTITVTNPTQPEGAPIEVVGLGVFPNGSTVEIPEEVVADHEAAHHGKELDSHTEVDLTPAEGTAEVVVEPPQAPEENTVAVFTGQEPVQPNLEDKLQTETDATQNAATTDAQSPVASPTDQNPVGPEAAPVQTDPEGGNV